MAMFFLDKSEVNDHIITSLNDTLEIYTTYWPIHCFFLIRSPSSHVRLTRCGVYTIQALND